MNNWFLKGKFNKVDLEFRNSIGRIEHLSEITRNSLVDFPNNLPVNLKDGLERDLKKIRDLEDTDENMFLETSIIRMYYEFETSIDLGMNDFLNYYHSQTRAHQLIMIFANFEAYLSDIADLVHQMNPNILISDKKMTYEEIIKAGSFNELLRQMAEKKIEKIGLKPFLNSVDAYVNFMSIEVNIVRSTRGIIEKAYQIRNIWVHNGGKVDQKFSDISGDTSVPVGEIYQINKTLLKKCKSAILKTQQEVHNCINNSYFS